MAALLAAPVTNADTCVIARQDSNANPSATGRYIVAGWYAEVRCAEPRDVRVEFTWLDARGDRGRELIYQLVRSADVVT